VAMTKLHLAIKHWNSNHLSLSSVACVMYSKVFWGPSFYTDTSNHVLSTIYVIPTFLWSISCFKQKVV